MTIYSILKDSGVKFSKEDCNKIGAITSKSVTKIDRVKQTETFDGKEQFAYVNVYSSQDKEAIYEIISNYYTNKTL